ncbi:M56 family metallopeptidase [Kineococcus gynurae]|uniref:M56 family metallopeptidase n=1 Tax=Kineococcus gynurae TaxID=452979 RepID=UPI0036D35FB4
MPDALDVLVPAALVAPLALHGLTPRIGELAPGVRVRRLSLAAAASTAAALVALVVLAVILLARVPWVAANASWVVAALPEPDLGWGWAVPLGVVLAALTVAATRHHLAVRRNLRAATELLAALGPAAPGGPCAVLDEARVDAFAVPPARRPGGRRTPGGIVVSRAMLGALDADQQEALLAHEQAHLTRRHHGWIQLAELSAAVNPLARNASRAVREAAEQEADLDAAARVGRVTTARAIAAATLARTAPRPDPGMLAATGGDVGRRVRLLLEPAVARPRAARRAGAALTLLLVGASLTATATTYAAVARLQEARTNVTVPATGS